MELWTKNLFFQFILDEFKSSHTPELWIFSFLKWLLGAKWFWLGVQMDFSHNLVLIIGKRLQTNLSCYCHSSIRRKHMSFLWPQGTVPLCAELSTLQGGSEDIFNEAGKCYGFSDQRKVCCCKWRLPAALFLPALCAGSAETSTVGPGCAIPTAASSPRCSCPHLGWGTCCFPAWYPLPVVLACLPQCGDAPETGIRAAGPAVTWHAHRK